MLQCAVMGYNIATVCHVRLSDDDTTGMQTGFKEGTLAKCQYDLGVKMHNIMPLYISMCSPSKELSMACLFCRCAKRMSFSLFCLSVFLPLHVAYCPLTIMHRHNDVRTCMLVETILLQ